MPEGRLSEARKSLGGAGSVSTAFQIVVPEEIFRHSFRRNAVPHARVGDPGTKTASPNHVPYQRNVVAAAQVMTGPTKPGIEANLVEFLPADGEVGAEWNIFVSV